MATYLLLWNPRRWPARRLVPDIFESTQDGLYARWSSGNCRSIVAGDRLFLAHVGKEPRGIIAAGVAMSSPRPGNHWDKTLAGVGRKTWYVEGVFEAALDPRHEPILNFDLLRARGVHFNWAQRSSGAELPPAVAVSAEDAWRELVGPACLPGPVVEPTAMEGLTTETVRYARGRSRRLRDEALRRARGMCEACGCDFTRLLHGRGVRVLQVHHRKQLSAVDKPRLTSVKDLAVLCANCHALTHMNPWRALKVDVLRKLMGRTNGD